MPADGMSAANKMKSGDFGTSASSSRSRLYLQRLAKRGRAFLLLALDVYSRRCRDSSTVR